MVGVGSSSSLRADSSDDGGLDSFATIGDEHLVREFKDGLVGILVELLSS